MWSPFCGSWASRGAFPPPVFLQAALGGRDWKGDGLQREQARVSRRRPRQDRSAALGPQRAYPLQCPHVGFRLLWCTCGCGGGSSVVPARCRLVRVRYSSGKNGFEVHTSEPGHQVPAIVLEDRFDSCLAGCVADVRRHRGVASLRLVAFEQVVGHTRPVLNACAATNSPGQHARWPIRYLNVRRDCQRGPPLNAAATTSGIDAFRKGGQLCDR